MIEQIISYLEKLGYTVEEQGNLAKYLVVFKAGRPIGFVFPDLTVKLVTGTGEQDNIEKIIDFINQNKGLESAGKSEFLLASFRGNQLTTFFDVKSMCVKYASYIVGNTGETKSIIYENYDTAVFSFLTQTHMIDLKKLLPKRESFSERTRTRLINYLLSKSQKQAERQ